jgi:hypothetical protein
MLLGCRGGSRDQEGGTMRIPVDFDTMKQDIWSEARRVRVPPERVDPSFQPWARVTIYDDTMEVDATLEHDRVRQTWWARPDWSTRRNVARPATGPARRLEPEAAISLLERAWAPPNGVFYRLRQGQYDSAGIAAVVDLLNAIDPGASPTLPRRLVALTWGIPTFIGWQVERVGRAGGDLNRLRSDIERAQQALERLLGVP